MSREQEIIESLNERLKEIKGICTFFSSNFRP